MTVTERLMGAGAFSVPLIPETPGPVRDLLDPNVSMLGHVVVTPRRVDLASMSDADALSMAQYAGIYRHREDNQDGSLELSGDGLNGWLGNGSIGPSTGGTGTAAQTFAQWATRCTPAELGVGIRSAIAGTYSKEFGLSLLNEIASDVAERFDAAWRVTTAGKLDFGTYAALFRSTPVALVVRRAADAGREFKVRGVMGELNVSRDVEDSPRRVVFRYDDAGTPTDVINVGGVLAADYPFRAFNGDAANMDMLVEDSQVKSSGDATARASSMMGRVGGVRKELTLSSSEYFVGDDVAVGDMLWVFDRERGIYNLGNQVTYRGRTIYPESIRCVGLTWPVRRGMGVWFRRFVKPSSTWVVEWTDLTSFVEFEDGVTTVEVGAKPRSILR